MCKLAQTKVPDRFIFWAEGCTRWKSEGMTNGITIHPVRTLSLFVLSFMAIDPITVEIFNRSLTINRQAGNWVPGWPVHEAWTFCITCTGHFVVRMFCRGHMQPLSQNGTTCTSGPQPSAEGISEPSVNVEMVNYCVNIPSQPHGACRGKVGETPRPLWFILRDHGCSFTVLWLSNSCWDISVWAKPTDRHCHAASMADRNYTKQQVFSSASFPAVVKGWITSLLKQQRWGHLFIWKCLGFWILFKLAWILWEDLFLPSSMCSWYCKKKSTTCKSRTHRSPRMEKLKSNQKKGIYIFFLFVFPNIFHFLEVFGSVSDLS